MRRPHGLVGSNPTPSAFQHNDLERYAARVQPVGAVGVACLVASSLSSSPARRFALPSSDNGSLPPKR
jgi:hypothetical protein